MNAGFYYKSAAEREALVESERKFTDDKVQKIIDLKNKVRGGKEPYHIWIQYCSNNRFAKALKRDLL